MPTVRWVCRPEDSEPSHWFLRIKVDASKLQKQDATSNETLTVRAFKEKCAAAVAAEGIPGVQPDYRYIVSQMRWFVERTVFPGSGAIRLMLMQLCHAAVVDPI
eukprot:SAG31_NODE_20322_length_577_cov_1.715481_2_plen_104_part_00